MVNVELLGSSDDRKRHGCFVCCRVTKSCWNVTLCWLTNSFLYRHKKKKLSLSGNRSYSHLQVIINTTDCRSGKRQQGSNRVIEKFEAAAVWLRMLFTSSEVLKERSTESSDFKNKAEGIIFQLSHISLKDQTRNRSYWKVLCVQTKPDKSPLPLGLRAPVQNNIHEPRE